MIRRPSGIALIAVGILLCIARAQGPAENGLSLTTRDRRDGPGWWPTKGNAVRGQYVGSDTCKGCHGRIAALQETTPMFHAGVRAVESQILQAQPKLTFRENGFSYSLTYEADGVALSAKKGNQQSTAPVVWAFGAGEYGQTYLLEKNGAYIEGRLSYFKSLNALDITPGQSSKMPQEAEESLGKTLDASTAEDCFRCHTTEAVTSGRLQSDEAIPGVKCESCHGPGAPHVAVMKNAASKRGGPAIMNPRYLSPSDSVDFCGACHRTWSDVTMEMPTNMGAARVRFQPYRLEMSRCWGKAGDARITCMACHDPHRPLVRDLSAYDTKCLACHSGATGSAGHAMAKKCRVGTNRCASCHMPRVNVPEAHATFTDHDIRVVHTKEPDNGNESQ